LIVVDEYLAVRVVAGRWPEGLPDDDDLLLPASRHWRLLLRIHAPGQGQLSRALGELTQAGRDGIRYPHPELLLIADPRPLLDEAARVAARYGGGWLVAETLAMGLHHGRALWFGAERNVGRILHAAADELGIVLNIAT
jgi:hypothetical protein